MDEFYFKDDYKYTTSLSKVCPAKGSESAYIESQVREVEKKEKRKKKKKKKIANS